MDEPAAIEATVVLFSLDDERRKRLAVNPRRERSSEEAEVGTTDITPLTEVPTEDTKAAGWQRPSGWRRIETGLLATESDSVSRCGTSCGSKAAVREPELRVAQLVCDEMASRARRNIEVIVERLMQERVPFRTNDDEQTPVTPHIPPTPIAARHAERNRGG